MSKPKFNGSKRKPAIKAPKGKVIGKGKFPAKENPKVETMDKPHVQVYSELTDFLDCDTTELADIAGCYPNQISRFFDEGKMPLSTLNLLKAVLDKAKGKKVKLNMYEQLLAFLSDSQIKVIFNVIDDNGNFSVRCEDSDGGMLVEGQLSKKSYSVFEVAGISDHYPPKRTFNTIKNHYNG